MAAPDCIRARKTLLRGWLDSRLTPSQLDWVDQRRQAISSDTKIGTLAAAIGLAPRKVGKSDLGLLSSEIKAARTVRSNLDPSDWSVDQATRILFALERSSANVAAFANGLDQLWQATEVTEQIALLRGLPLYLEPERLVPRALRVSGQPCSRSSKPSHIAIPFLKSSSAKRNGTRWC
jgi:hypothetical protein